MTTTEEERLSLSEMAEKAWKLRWDYDLTRARQSFQTQMFRKLKIRRDEYELLDLMFEREYDAALQIGCSIDQMDFCLDKNGALSVVAWQCAEKKCRQIRRVPFSDLATLGRAIARGEQLAIAYPKCDQHTKS